MVPKYPKLVLASCVLTQNRLRTSTSSLVAAGEVDTESMEEVVSIEVDFVDVASETTCVDCVDCVGCVDCVDVDCDDCDDCVVVVVESVVPGRASKRQAVISKNETIDDRRSVAWEELWFLRFLVGETLNAPRKRLMLESVLNRS